MRKVLLSLCAVLLLTACSPKYETRYELTPPKTTAGLAGIKSCDVKAQQCAQRCGEKYDQCSLKAQQEAAKVLPKMLHDYELELARWERRYSDYQRDLLLYRMMRDLRTEHRHCKKDEKCNHSHRRYYDYFDYPFIYPSSPGSRPSKPTLASVAAKIRKQTCRKDCGCQTQFRQCYSANGGLVKPHQVCVKNCN